MNPRQQSDVERWLTDTGLGDTWHQSAPSAAEFPAAHPEDEPLCVYGGPKAK